MYIRADGNDTIATGHVMRCIAIADALKAKGEDTIFIIADEYPKEIIEQHGYKTICLNTVWNDMDTETDKMIELIEQKRIEKILVDSYFVTEIYLEKLKEYSTIIYMDDLNQKSGNCRTFRSYHGKCGCSGKYTAGCKNNRETSYIKESRWRTGRSIFNGAGRIS